jgi:hypothetical protein
VCVGPACKGHSPEKGVSDGCAHRPVGEAKLLFVFHFFEFGVHHVAVFFLADIEAKMEALGKASQKLGEIMYAQAQAEGQPAADGAQAAGGSAGKKEDGNVVDAEFEEVKDKK